MFQKFDNRPSHLNSVRQDWIALLARAPLPLLNSILSENTSSLHWLRRPETGLMMIQGRIGGNGDKFNIGEVTVTRCALRLLNADKQSPVGVSYVLGRDHQHARLAAIADAMLQEPEQYATLEISLLAPIREHLQTLKAQRHEKAQSTKVDFLTVAREASFDEQGMSS
jgi:alpha-D-ribose 1-methylphosphonate 5-triphosphate synthase subunit PhnG